MSGNDGYSGLAASGTECFRNYILSIFREVEFGKFPAREPADLGGITGSNEFASYSAAQEVNQNVVILHSVFGIAQDAVIDAQQLVGLHDQSGLFAGFTHGGFANHLADFEDTAGDGPVSLNRWMGALYQYNAIGFDNDGAYTDQREFGEFAFHFEL
jgi:hypothetical protein